MKEVGAVAIDISVLANANQALREPHQCAAYPRKDDRHLDREKPCTNRPQYLAFFTGNPPGNAGSPLCEKHAALVRSWPTLERMTSYTTPCKPKEQ